MTSHYRQPYIASQRVHCLRPEVSRDQLFLGDVDVLLEAHDHRHSRHWTTYDSSDPLKDLAMDILADTRARDLCIINEAGMGKTVAMQRLQMLWQAKCRDSLVIRITPSEFGVDSTNEEWKSCLPPLAARIAQDIRLYGSQFRNLAHSDLLQVVESHCHSGRLILLLDGLDHIDQIYKRSSESPRSIPLLARIRNLRDKFANQQIRYVFSGRPYAFDQCWDRLGLSPDAWVVQLAYFDERDQKAYLTDTVFQKLKELDTELIRIPRALEAIRDRFVPLQTSANGQVDHSEVFESLRSASDVYRESVRFMLTQGFQNKYDLPRALLVFSAVAFDMAENGKSELTSSDIDRGHLELIYERLTPELKNGFRDSSNFRDTVREIQRINEGWQHALFEKLGSNLGLYWRDKTLRDFFAAMWVVCFSESPTVCAFQDKSSAAGSFCRYRSELYWVWRFASEWEVNKPWPAIAEGKQWVRMLQRWLHSLAKPGAAKTPIEFVYRAWDQLNQLKDEGVQEAVTALTDFATAVKREHDVAIIKSLRAQFKPIPGSPEQPTLWLKDFPVTHAEYRLFDETQSFPGEHLDHPAVGVNFFEAQVYCYWLGQILANSEPGRRVECRLPNYDEWKSAFTAGAEPGKATRIIRNNRVFSVPEEQIAFHFGLGDTNAYRPRCQAHANSEGFYDMPGNVWEWLDEFGIEDRAKRRVMGGSWRNCDSFDFSPNGPGQELEPHRKDQDDVGFRPLLIVE